MRDTNSLQGGTGQRVGKRIRRTKVGSVGQFFQGACEGQVLERNLEGNVRSREVLFFVFEGESHVSILNADRSVQMEESGLNMQEAERSCCWLEGAGPWAAREARPSPPAQA